MPKPPQNPTDAESAHRTAPDTEETAASLSRHARLVSGLSQNAPTVVDLRPDAEESADIARAIGVSGLRKISFRGEIKAQGKRDWALSGTLGVTIIQPCVVSLEPVTTRIDADVTRRFLANWHGNEDPGAETEMPEDVSIDALSTHIDPWAVMVEEIALHAPDFPRAPDAAIPGPTSVTEPGQAPLTDAEIKPFAGLAALRDQLAKDDSTDS